MKNENLPSIRCTVGFKVALERLAKNHSKTLTDFVRDTLQTAIQDEFGDNWEAVMVWHPESTFLLEAR